MIKIKFLKKNLQFFILFYIIGIVMTLNHNNTYTIVSNDKTNLHIFILIFSLNYVYFFLMWFLENLNLKIINNIIAYYRVMLDGILLGLYGKSYGVYGVIIYLKFFIIDLLIIYPLIVFSKETQHIKRDIKLIIITIITILYAAILSFIN